MGYAILHNNKGLLGLVMLFSTVLFIFLIDRTTFISSPVWTEIQTRPQSIKEGNIQEWWAYRQSMANLSKLGEILFLQKPEPEILATNKKYQILIWKYGPLIENRHLKHFSGHWIDPFGHCPVKNCNITHEDSALKTADIVIFHMFRIKGLQDIPTERDPHQIWAFLIDESPSNLFKLHPHNKFKDFNGLFNWSMTYRMDSDIPVPYGRTVLKKKSEAIGELNFVKRRDVLVAIMSSNCHATNHRLQYVRELQKYIQVDVYGKCGTNLKNRCPGHYRSDCPAIDEYLFYLSFENSNCDEYLTEKVWWSAYHKNSIPIVMGSSKATYEKLLPLNSYINTDDFANPQVLAQFLLHLNKTEEYRSYYNWKKNFEVLNEHGFFQSKAYHYCRVCQALNYNTKETKVFSDLEQFWSVKRDCHRAWDRWQN